MKEYHKIETLFMRDADTKNMVIGNFRNETIEYLKDNTWYFTEKIDGTNIRVHWDGHTVSFGGRTDRANIPSSLMNKLIELFGGAVNEEMFEQKFGETEVTLYGEGYGAGIQKGGAYRSDVSFILFDVEINGMWLRRSDVEDIADFFGIEVVPVVAVGSIDFGIRFVMKHPKSTIGNADMEGVVGKPLFEMYDRRGKRVIVKIKWEDFKHIVE